MRRSVLALATAAVAVTAAAAVLALRAAGAEPAEPTPAARTGRRAAAPPRTGGPLVSQARFRLELEQEVTVPGKPPVRLRAEGAWTEAPRPDGRTEVRFSPAVLDGPPGELPRREDLEAAAQLVRADGVLIAIGFPDDMPAKARRLLTAIATTFQYTDRPGDGWTAAEEDLSGRYDAVYVRGRGGIERRRPRYTALRGPAGLTAEAAAGASPAEQTRFVVDADGIVTAAVELDVAFAVGDGIGPVALRLRARLAREAIEPVAAPAGRALAGAPISGFADFEGARRNADASLVAGASLPELLAEVKRAAALPGREGGSPRAQVLAKLAALIRLEPEAAAEIAAHVRGHAARLEATRVLAGALASARIAAGTDALAGLMKGELPEAARAIIAGALSFADPVTPASLAALSAELEGAQAAQGAQAAYGLGTHGRKARAGDPAAADAAIELLLERHARAGSDAERRLYLEALGNGGAARALPVLRAALEAGDDRLAPAAAFSLRFVPGPDADALLEQTLARSLERPQLALAAIRAAAYREPARWRAQLLAAQERFPGHDGIQGEIRAILRRWSR
jgi:hypothetical protein